MFNNFLILPSALYFINSVTAIQFISSDNLGAIVKNIPMNIVRELSSTSPCEICYSESFDLLNENQDIIDVMPDINPEDYANSPYCSGAEMEYVCDYKNAFSGLEAACDGAGGQFIEYSVTAYGQGLSISFKNFASCYGASCDKDAMLKTQEELYSKIYSGVEVTFKESGASTLSSVAVAMIALTGSVATLI